MPERNTNQKIANVVSGCDERKELFSVPFVGCARLRRSSGKFYVKDSVRNADGTYESSDEREVSGHYDPPFVVRSVTCNTYEVDDDTNLTGHLIYFDLPQYTQVPVKIWPWFGMPMQVTRVYLDTITEDIDLILWK